MGVSYGAVMWTVAITLIYLGEYIDIMNQTNRTTKHYDVLVPLLPLIFLIVYLMITDDTLSYLGTYYMLFSVVVLITGIILSIMNYKFNYKQTRR